MMGRGRTHYHFTKQKERRSVEKTTIAMDWSFMKMKSVVKAQTMSGESVTCIVVKEDRHKNIMSSVAWKKGLEERRGQSKGW